MKHSTADHVYVYLTGEIERNFTANITQMCAYKMQSQMQYISMIFISKTNMHFAVLLKGQFDTLFAFLMIVSQETVSLA